MSDIAARATSMMQIEGEAIASAAEGVGFTALAVALVATPALLASIVSIIALGASVSARPRIAASLGAVSLRPVESGSDDSLVYAHNGETLDALLWRARGLGSGMVEQVLAANPGLAAIGPHLPEGHAVFIPVLDDVGPLTLDLIQLWD